MEKLQQTYQMIGIFLSMIELSVIQYMDISVLCISWLLLK